MKKLTITLSDVEALYLHNMATDFGISRHELIVNTLRNLVAMRKPIENALALAQQTEEPHGPEH